jgi:hypothetical protein
MIAFENQCQAKKKSNDQQIFVEHKFQRRFDVESGHLDSEMEKIHFQFDYFVFPILYLIEAKCVALSAENFSQIFIFCSSCGESCEKVFSNFPGERTSNVFGQTESGECVWSCLNSRVRELLIQPFLI